jgi:luciferase family oxidoreductase group 1
VQLSVLDLAPVVTGSTPARALQGAIELARLADRLGYTRYWVAEHHNMPGVASSAPAVLIAHAASATERIRVGSGGVMLPNHPPLVVAEQFGMLEALHPGRIDLGIGRAPGTDPLTARALRRSEVSLSAEEFPRQLGDLLSFFTGEWPAGHPYEQVTAVPGKGYRPEVWLLGSSDYSAQVAGLLGFPFSFAHHFSPANTDAAAALYRERFTPSSTLDAPHLSLGVSVVCAERPRTPAGWPARPRCRSSAAGPGGRPRCRPRPRRPSTRSRPSSGRCCGSGRRRRWSVTRPRCEPPSKPWPSAPVPPS